MATRFACIWCLVPRDSIAIVYHFDVHAALQAAGAYRPDGWNIILSTYNQSLVLFVCCVSCVCIGSILRSQDVVCELICDHRFPDDTLFMIFEEDYRFWPIGEDPDHCDDYHDRLEDVLKRGRAKTSGAYRPDQYEDDPAASGAKGEAAKGKAKGFRVAGKWHYTPQRGSTDLDENNEGLNEEVADLIRIATLCHRNKMGDIIWFGWECHGTGNKPTWLWKGSHGLMLTKRGAHHIEVGMRTGQIERDHIDLALAWWLRRPTVAARAGACYIYPPMGAYFAHPSGCDPKNFGADKGGRPHGWDGNLNPARGTRKSTDQNDRAKWIIQWTGEGKIRPIGSGLPSHRTMCCTATLTGGSPTRKSLPPHCRLHRQQIQEQQATRRRKQIQLCPFRKPRSPR